MSKLEVFVAIVPDLDALSFEVVHGRVGWMPGTMPGPVWLLRQHLSPAGLLAMGYAFKQRACVRADSNSFAALPPFATDSQRYWFRRGGRNRRSQLRSYTTETHRRRDGTRAARPACAFGRITDGTIMDTMVTETRKHHGGPLAQDDRSIPTPQIIVYVYRIAGVTYECAQDVTALAEYVHGIRTDLPIQVRYLPQNPANSIVVAESWSGLRLSSSHPYQAD